MATGDNRGEGSGLSAERSDAAEVSHSESRADAVYTYTVDAGGSAHLLRCAAYARAVEVPRLLGGHPVVSVAHSAFAALDTLEMLTLPDSITKIGWSAFANCVHLKRLVLPARVDALDQTWLAGCSNLMELALPAAMETIAADFLRSCHPSSLIIGAGTRTVEVPPFWTASCRQVAVDARNPYLMTDGVCLYTKDGMSLVRCLVESDDYAVAEGCREICTDAFAFHSRLRSIRLPDSLEFIGEGAFQGAPLESLRAPQRLKGIGSNAFARCARLRTVALNPCLETLGDAPFDQCESLQRLELPASVRHVGRHILAGTSLSVREGEETFSLDPENNHLFLKGGLLYGTRPDGFVLLECMDLQLRCCTAETGTVSVADDAFRDQGQLEQIDLPEGCREVGAGAFSGCASLKRIGLPSSLERIGTRAFFGTSLERVYLPAAVEYMGSCAFAPDWGEGREEAAPLRALCAIEVDPGNKHFFVQSGILCEWMAGYARGVLYVGPDVDVSVPQEVTEIGPYAFAGVGGLERLVLHAGIAHIGTKGLAFRELPAYVEIQRSDAPATDDDADVGKAGAGEPGVAQAGTAKVGVVKADPALRRAGGGTLHSPFGAGMSSASGNASRKGSLRLRPLQNRFGLRAWRNAVSGGAVDTGLLADSMDRIALYERDPVVRARYMLGRLHDPCLLSPALHAGFDRALRRSLEDICVACAQAGWNGAFDLLADQGFLNEQTITGVIDAVNAEGSVNATAYLIGLKAHRMQTVLDLDL